MVEPQRQRDDSIGQLQTLYANELNELRQVGLDLADVKCQNDIDAEVTRWAHAVAYERFDLLEKIGKGDGESQRSEIASRTQRREVRAPFGSTKFLFRLQT